MGTDYVTVNLSRKFNIDSARRFLWRSNLLKTRYTLDINFLPLVTPYRLC